MKATRFGAAKREPSRASSRTKSGTVRSARAAAERAGWSWTRRSRLKRTSAVFTSPTVARYGQRSNRSGPSGRDETEEERLDRNLGELLQELRVALPGVQVLFAFLLAVPFQQHFTKITEFEKRVYFATLLLTAISAALLIAPSAYHRLTFRYQQKHRLVFIANRLAIAGLGVLALAMTCAVMLITDVLFGTVATIVTVAVVFAMFVAALGGAAAAAPAQVPGRGSAASRSARRQTERLRRARRGRAAPAPRARSIASVRLPDFELQLQRHLELVADRVAFALRASACRVLELVSLSEP